MAAVQDSCSIIIIAYNSCDFIPACLKSVRDACEGIDAQIIVLDNGSPEPILPEIKSFFPEVQWIDSKENLGFGKGCNLAEKSATKPYLFFINPDTIISRDSFREMLAYMRKRPDAGIVGCRILNEDGSLQLACRRSFPTITASVAKTLGLASLFPKSKTLASYNMTYADPDQETEVDAVSGSFFCIERSFYEELGGFDEDFFMYGEDLDLCFRSKESGRKNYYAPVTNILHFRGQSSRTRRVKSYINFYQAMLIFAKKHRKLYLMPHFLVAFGIIFAALVGVFSRLIPQFWKIFLDLGMMTLTYKALTAVTQIPSPDWKIFGVFACVNLIVLMFRGEYATSSLKGEKFFSLLYPMNLLIMLGLGFYARVSGRLKLELHDFTDCLYLVAALLIMGSVFGILYPLVMKAWRRVAFWINYFYRIFAKKRHRSILLGGAQDSLQNWFDHYNVIPGVEILGCVSSEKENVTENNRLHLLGDYSQMESICNRTGCRELLVVSNFSGYREPFDIEWLDKLNLTVYLLIGDGKDGNFALVNLKYLH